MKQTIRALFPVVFLLTAGELVTSSRAQTGGEKSEWTAADTVLANQYLQLLGARPGYSKVFELLWSHYADHDATQLLLNHFDAAANSENASAAERLVYAHLLRRSGDSAQARLRYEELLTDRSVRSFALVGLAEISLENLGEPESAEKYFLQLKAGDAVEEEVIRRGLIALADLYLSRSSGESALRIWREILTRWPSDLGLLQDLGARMITAGYLEEAIDVYDGLREVANPELRVAVLLELARIHELADQFEPAAAALNEGRNATHFKHHTHLEFLSMLVRLYERHDRLEEIEEQLLSMAGDGEPSEQSLFTLVRFYDLTARPLEREKWLRAIVSAVPGRVEYRRELVEVLISNDQYVEARKLIDRLLEEGSPETLSLRLLRVRIELSVGGRDAGTTLLRGYLAENAINEQERNDVLHFAEAHFLDDVAEQLLRDRIDAGDDESVFRLVELHHSRGRLAKAREILDDFVSKASDDPVARAERLFRSASALQGIGLNEAALEVLKEAVALQPGNRDYLVRYAELEAEAKHIEKALEHYEIAWSQCETDDDRTDIDQRIYSLLQLTDLQSGVKTGIGKRIPNPPRSSEISRMIRSQRPGGSATVVVAPSEGGIGNLLKFSMDLRERARASGSPKEQLRAAWWANAVEDYSGATEILSRYRETNPPNIRAETLLLEVAEASKQTLLALRQLELLAKMDAERKIEYDIRRAQIRIGQGEETFQEEAFADLKEIASDPGADVDLLKRLAQVYGKLGRNENALDLYRRAFDMSSLHEKRRMIAELNRLQSSLGRYEDALEAMTNLIQVEHDLRQRRKELTSQLNLAMQHQLLDKLERDYGLLQRRYPLDPFYSEALALVAENLGKNGEAFAAIRKAYYGSRSRDGHLLERMRQLAAKTKDVEAAIYYQKQVVAAPGERAEAPEWHKLIKMLEMDLQVAEAGRIRVRLESKFAQDPDVLSELADYYLEVRQPAAARRVLARMARLRPWHINTLLKLGILEKEAGNFETAGEFFLQALDHTEEAAGADENEVKIERFPTRGFSKGGRPELSNRKKALEQVVGVLDDTRLIDNRLRVQLAHYFESGRPEYQPVPDKPGVQRLRAIEELGEVMASAPRFAIRDEFEAYWKENPAGSIEERFWIEWAGDRKDEAWAILEEHSRGAISPVDEFLICMYGAHAGRFSELTRWITETNDLNGERRRRISWLLAALVHVAVEDRSLPGDEQLASLFESGLLASPHIYSMLNLLNKEGLVREALYFGGMARHHGIRLPAHFEYSLATLAYKSGDPSLQRELLEGVLGDLDPAGARFQEAAALLYETMEPGESRFQMAGRMLDILSTAPEHPRPVFGRARILALAGDDDGAAKALRDVVALHLGQAKSIHASPTENLLNPNSQWMSLFDYALSARRLGLTRVGRDAFTEALTASDLAVPRAEQTAAYFQHYLFQQILWEFEDLSFLERKALLQAHRSRLRSNEEREALARTLAGEGYHRDTIEIYGRLLHDNPQENDYARSFLSACATAGEYEPAIDYLNQILSKELPPPEGASGSYFQQQHALFLGMAQDRERLRAFATQQSRVGRHLSPNDRYYHHALAALLVEQGDLEGALEVFSEIDDGSHHHPVVLRDHAKILRQLGRDAAAIELLERAVPTGRSAPARPIVEEMAAIYAATKETEKLRRLTLTSLESLDDELAVKLAQSLAVAGMQRDAEGVLLFALQRVKSDAARFHLLVPAIEISLKSESLERVEPFLEILCVCDPAEAGEDLALILGLVRKQAGGKLASAMNSYFADREAHVRSGALASLCRLEIAIGGRTGGGEVEEIVSRLRGPTVRPSEIAAAADICLREGAIEYATRLIGTLRDRHQDAVTYAPLTARYHAATGNAAGSADLFKRIIRNQGSGSITDESLIEIAAAFAEGGDEPRAARILKHSYEGPRSPGGTSFALLDAYREFLVKRGDYLEAQVLLQEGFRRGTLSDPAMIIDLYEDWSRLERLPSELSGFDLGAGALLKLERLLADRMKGKEGLSETRNLK